MKHSFKRTAAKWLRIMDDLNGRPTLAYGNDDIRPYWKCFGTGEEKLMIEKEFGDTYLIRSINHAEGANSAKETWIHLDKKTAAIVGAFLQGRAVNAEEMP